MKEDCLDVFVGIDVGKKGGIAAITALTPFVWPMPLLNNEINIVVLIKILETCKRMAPRLHIAVEKVHAMPKNGVSSMFSFGTTYGIVLASSASVSPTTFRLVSARTWQKHFFSGITNTGQTKEMAKQQVQWRYPSVNLVPEGCRVPNEGISDAIGIADWLQNQITGSCYNVNK